MKLHPIRWTCMTVVTLTSLSFGMTANAQAIKYSALGQTYGLLNGDNIALYISDRGDLGVPRRQGIIASKPPAVCCISKRFALMSLSKTYASRRLSTDSMVQETKPVGFPTRFALLSNTNISSLISISRVACCVLCAGRRRCLLLLHFSKYFHLFIDTIPKTRS